MENSIISENNLNTNFQKFLSLNNDGNFPNNRINKINNLDLNSLKREYSTEIQNDNNCNSSFRSLSLRSSSYTTNSCVFNQYSGKSKIKKMYAPKCICLVSVYPFCNEMMKILKAIYKFSTTSRLKKPLEKLIENLVIEVPVPPRGLYTVNYQLSNENICFNQTKMNELPYVSIDLEKIFINFKFEQIFEIYKQLLLETRLIFFSKEMALLSPIIHGFLTLIYPFKYIFNYVTVIPEENFPILDNISPFVLGINEQYDKNFFKKHQLDVSEYNYLVIDIDNRGIELNCPLLKGERECNKKKILLKEFPELPVHYKKKLQEKLKDYINTIKTNETKESKEKFICSIRGFFYQFIVSLFMDYSKFLNYDYYNNKNMPTPSVNNLFKVDDFLKSVKVEDRPFYRKFILETQMFSEFIYRRMIPKDAKEKLEILLFDEHITEKNNRKFMSKKVHTYFLQTNLYDFKQTYYVEKHRSFTEEEIKYFKKVENRQSALRNGIDVIVSGEEILLNYFFFPTLMTDFYFKNNLNNYIIAMNLSETLEQINVEMVSRSHLSKKTF